MSCDKIVDRLNSLRRDGLLCDVHIVADCQEFAAHRAVLAASSDYFKALFTTPMVEQQNQRVNLQVPSSVVEELLTFLYTGKTHICEENVKELLIAADYLVVDELKSKCVECLTAILESSNCVEILSLSVQCNCPLLKEKAQGYILKNFQTLMKTYEFQLLDVDQLEWFIGSDEIIIDSEEVVIQAIETWMVHRLEEREQFFERLFCHVRLCCLSGDYLEELTQTKHTARIQQYLLQSSDSETDQLIHPRKCLRKDSHALVCIGGMCRGTTLKEVTAVNPQDDKWLQLCDMESEREEHTVVTCNGVLYVIGGMKSPYSIDCYEPSANAWSTVAVLPERAISSAAVCLDGKIVIMGGTNGFETVSLVHCYDTSSNILDTSTSLTSPRKALCAVAVNNIVYVIGGCTYDNDSLDTVEKLDPSDGYKWTSVAPLKKHRKYACAEVLSDGKILVVGGYQDTNATALRSCELYSPVNNEWQEICSLIVPRAAAAMACIDSKVYIVGGRSDRVSTDTIEYYDQEKDTWFMTSTLLPHPWAWLQCGILSDLDLNDQAQS